jgi:hypothetical protein
MGLKQIWGKYLHHDYPLQIIVHRAGMKVSTQVNQVLQTVQMDFSNVSSSIERLVKGY